VSPVIGVAVATTNPSAIKIRARAISSPSEAGVIARGTEELMIGWLVDRVNDLLA
jgi:hypothetical protein